MLYDKIPNALRLFDTFSQTPSKEFHVFDGVIGSNNRQSMSKPCGLTLAVTSQSLPTTPVTS